MGVSGSWIVLWPRRTRGIVWTEVTLHCICQHVIQRACWKPMLELPAVVAASTDHVALVPCNSANLAMQPPLVSCRFKSANDRLPVISPRSCLSPLSPRQTLVRGECRSLRRDSWTMSQNARQNDDFQQVARLSAPVWLITNVSVTCWSPVSVLPSAVHQRVTVCGWEEMRSKQTDV